MNVGFESAIGSHVGLVRLNNQDSGYAGNRLFLVADGMGGHAGGDVASAQVTRTIARIDELLHPAGTATTQAAETETSFDEVLTEAANTLSPDSPRQTGDVGHASDAPEMGFASQPPTGIIKTADLNDAVVADSPVTPQPTAAQAAQQLADSLKNANNLLRETVEDRPELAGLGTTFTGFITVDDQLALAHIGDSRLYLLRDGRMTQVTKDHTFVQKLVDSGKITEEEAKTHPRRSVLMRVLGDVDSSPQIDTAVLDTKPGDVWLLCSDGLCGYVDEADIERVLRKRSSLQQGVDELINRALFYGAPDNVTVVLVETTPSMSGESHPGTPRFGGSAAAELEAEMRAPSAKHLSRRRSIRRAQPVEESHFEPRVDEYLNELIAETRRRNRRRRMLAALGLVGVLALLVGGVALAYQWTQTRYFVGTDGSTVIIYRGVQQNIGGFSLSSVAEDTEIPLSDLAGIERQQIERTLSADSIEQARDIVTRLGVNDNG